MTRIACLLLCVAAGCGNVSRPFADANGDDQQFDAADFDAAPQPPPTPSREVVGGAQRMSSGTYTFDVEIGHPVSQQPASGPTYTIEGNAAVKP